MRDNKVTIAKGLAIILMVLGHAIAYCSDVNDCSISGVYGWLYDFIYMFHMPVFFVLAGYCFKEKYLDIPKEFFKKRVKGLYKPFVKWGLIFLLLHNVFCFFHIYNEEYGLPGAASVPYLWKDFAVHALHIVTKMTDAEHMLGGYWFLHTLFFASLIGFTGIKLNKPKCAIIGGGILVFLLTYTHKNVPYFAVGNKEFLAALFFIVGHYYHKSKIAIHERAWTFIGSTALVVAGSIWWPTDTGRVEWWNVVPYFLSAIAGTLAVMYISGKIAIGQNVCSKFLVYVGDNTMTILTWHFLSFKLVSLLIIWIYGLPIAALAGFPTIAQYSAQGWFVAYLAVGTLVPLTMSRCRYLR